MNAEEKLIRARIQIQNRNPFFAYLSLYLKFNEVKVKKGEPDPLDGNNAGVDSEGNLYYKAEWIESLSDEEVIGLILHEIMHLSFIHLLRRGTRNGFGWNVAADIAVNQIILDNNFQLPKGGILPDNNEIVIFGQKITDLDKKSAELIFDELKLKTKQGNQPGGQPGFDKHFEGDKLTPEEKKKLENDWLNRIEEAYVGAKMKGNVPSGIERLIGKIHEAQINWKTVLQRYILSYIPYDYTYAKPNKKSLSAGYYMPDYLKEKIKVVIAIDTSGSIGEKELSDFLSEIIGIAKAYQNRVDMRLLCHDTEVAEDLHVGNGNIEKIKQLKCKGGGGTSHKPVFEYIEKNIRDAKVAVFLTDGYSDLETMSFKERFGKIFVIIKGGTTEWAKKKPCHVVELK